MKRITRYQTSDGALHESLKQATEHADNRFGKALTRLALVLTHTEGKYVKLSQALENMLPEFEELLKLKADIPLEDPTDEDPE